MENSNNKPIDTKRVFYLKTLNQIQDNLVVLGSCLGTESDARLSVFSSGVYQMANILDSYRAEIASLLTSLEKQIIKNYEEQTDPNNKES